MSAPELSSGDRVEVVVSEEEAGSRLDVFLASRFKTHSRVQLRRAIAAGTVLVDGNRTKVAYRLNAGQQISVILPDLPVDGPEPEDIPLQILYEDECMVAVNKPAGMVVHPARGHWSGTLTAALAFHFQQLSSVGGPTRPGIVHRLDRDTTGVIAIAKTDTAHLSLAGQFEARTVAKEYKAIVVGRPECDRDWVDQPIGQHPHLREKMAVRAGHSTSRSAQTFYEVEERFRRFALVRAEPKTGRTHQVRLHLQHIGCPVLCDRLYGRRAAISRLELLSMLGISCQSELADERLLDRQALHAMRLAVDHPISGARLEIEAPLPPDIASVLEVLRSAQ